MIKTLVIDDEKAFTEIALRFLSGFCEVMVAATAEEALKLVDASRPDIVVVDNQLPGLSGVDLVKRLRSGLDVHIVMVTIDKESDVAAALAPLTVDSFLKKPFRRADLEDALLNAIIAVKRKKGMAS